MKKFAYAVVAVVFVVTAVITRAQDPVKVDPKHYTLEFDNEQTRVMRVRFGPKEKGVEHEHTFSNVVVYLNDQADRKADDVRVAGAGTHAEENASAQPADRIAVELK